MKKIKKILLTLALTLCVLGSAFTFKACKCSSDQNSMSIKNVFAMSMVSASNYLDGGYEPRTVSEIDTQTENTIKEYTRVFEGLLSNGLHPTLEEVSSGDAYYNTYSQKLMLEIGNEKYAMYYTEVIEDTKTEVDDTEIEEETTSFLYGIVVKTIGEDSITYSVVGSREIESETQKDVTEVESELKLIFTTEELNISHTNKLDDLNLSKFSDYVVIEQEVEDGEIEFKYTTMTPSMQSPKTVEIEFEEDNNPTLEIKIETNSNKTKYEIVKVDTNKYAVKVKSDGNKVRYYVEKVDNTWTMKNA